jgi:hypothetical protein
MNDINFVPYILIFYTYIYSQSCFLGSENDSYLGTKRGVSKVKNLKEGDEITA